MFKICVKIFIITLISTICKSYQNDLKNSNLIPKLSTSYSFGYDIEDDSTRNVQFRNEHRHENGSVTGSYGYLQPDGNLHKVTYIADQYGYRASVEIKPRGVLKPIHINRPETQLFDFSSNLPPAKLLDENKFNEPEIPKRSNPAYEQNKLRGNFKYGNLKNTNQLNFNEYYKSRGFSKDSFPHNVPNYISKNVVEKPKYRMERGFVPYFPEKQQDLDVYKKLFKNYYVIPLK
nr:uncharacterized protein LOC111418946 [Onthophagus taurus]